MAEPSYGPAESPIEVVPVVVLSQVFPARPSSIPDIRDFVRRCLAESPLTEEGTREVGETVFRALLDAAGPTGSIQVAFRIFPEHVEVDVLHSDTALSSPLVPGAPVSYSQPGGAGRGVGHQPVTLAQSAGYLRPVPSGQPLPAGRPGSPSGSGGVQDTRGAADIGGTGAGGGGARGSWAGGGSAAGGSAGGGIGSAFDGPAAGEGPDLQPATFAEWMSSALRREGLTQEAAARQLGVSVKTVSRWVGGATEPRMRDLRRIQEVFGEIPLP